MSFKIKQQGDEIVMENASLILNAAGRILVINIPIAVSDIEEESVSVTAVASFPIIRDAMERKETLFEKAYGFEPEVADQLEILACITGTRLEGTDEWVMSLADYSFHFTDQEMRLELLKERSKDPAKLLNDHIQVSLGTNI